MKTAIIFISKHGTTQKVASEIAQKLKEEDTILIDLAKEKVASLQEFERIILGGSIHMGKVHKKTAFIIEKHHSTLLEKDLGLFLCCMEEGDKAKEQYELAFPADLRDHAKSTAMMGYEYLLEKMGFLEKIMVKKITGKDQSFSKIDEEAIDQFVEEIQD